MLDRPNRWPWPPIIYMVTAIMGVLIDRTLKTWPLPFPVELIWLGWSLVAAGVVIAVVGVVAFKTQGATVDPTGAATVLTTSGIYQLTRNPMYLGGIIFFLGLGLALRSGGLLMMVPIIWIALTWLAIIPEEAYLARRFGSAYDAYRAKVRRWI